ncbi:DNA-directed RNA polymerase subunit omega [Bremerella sp. P1]|uniref:DNA-directed RNA polymerase subunit omega n=1 Tax=Bremerella sp. P1 TaxID=3026424 RepID=UPI002368EC55|nr:DNA-directed RNA polymerase subunit omega [Bremerella sp. P1]WDI40843.1 DNA-directed RNA polymerase subunit omega [Bremerella sp. P1]
MLEELKEEFIIKKVGGRFKLSTLIQKRLVALNAGSRPLVEINSDNKMEIVLEEIKQDKIFLDTTNELRTAADGDVMIKSFDAMMSDEL